MLYLSLRDSLRDISRPGSLYQGFSQNTTEKLIRCVFGCIQRLYLLAWILTRIWSKVLFAVHGSPAHVPKRDKHTIPVL